MRPMGLEEIQAIRVSPKKSDSKVDKEMPKVQRYDLGIGKNQPVYGKASQAKIPENNFESTRYLVDHDATREYPSPIQQPIKTPTKHSIPIVQHQRRTKDVLHIDHPTPANKNHHRGGHSSSSHSNPISLPHIRATSNDQLDLNTIWVELMLHSEHIKSKSVCLT